MWRPGLEGLAVGEHPRKRARIRSTSDTRQPTEEEREVDLLRVKEIQALVDAFDRRLWRETELGAKPDGELAAEPCRVSVDGTLGERDGFALTL